jgi:CRP/FNR family transcriptional regulator
MEAIMHTASERSVPTHRTPTSLAGVPGETCLREVFGKQPVRHLSAGKPLFVEGEEATHVFEVGHGALRVFKIISDGRRVITGFLYPGDIIGLSVGQRYLYSAEAISAATVRQMTRAEFDSAVTDNPRLQPEFFALVSDEMAAAQDQMVLLSCKNAEERICSFLLKFLKRCSLPGERRRQIELPMCRQDIADYLGLTIETVSRTFTRLINKGVVSIENGALRHTIMIERPSLLAKLAGDGNEDDSWPDQSLQAHRAGH